MFPLRKIRHACLRAGGGFCFERRVSRAVLLAFALACLFACKRRDPQAAYDHAKQTLRKGDTVAAALEAEKGYKDFHAMGSEWAWKFTILKARALHLRGMNEEALSLLTSDSIPPPSGELVVQKLMWQGLACISLHKFPEAEQNLAEAERICAASDNPDCPDVLNAEGALQMERGHYAQAQGLFERVLVSARASGDPSWEANALLDLSWSAVAQEHFDEALDAADSARQIALPRNFGNVTQKALGNMGWAYYKLGDPEKAEAMFVEASKQAEKLGQVASHVGWLTNAAYIDLDAGRFSVAEHAFQQSLKLAKQINSREDVINSLIALAFLSEQTSKLDEAKRYAAEALSLAQADGNKRDEVYPRLVQGQVAAQQHDVSIAETSFREVSQSEDSPVFLKWEAERSLARLYEDENRPDSAEREYRTALSTFEAARSGLQHEDSRLPFLTNASRIYDDYIHFLVSHGRSAAALQWADFSRARTLAEGLELLPKGAVTGPPPLDPQQLARRAQGTILFYSLGEKQSYLWAVTPQKTSLFTLPPGGEIDAAVQRYRKSLGGPNDVLVSSDSDGQLLYRTLIAPAQAFLKRDAKVFIIPDGSLNNLNFETLLVPDSKPTDPKMPESNTPQPKVHYWIEDVTIADASSLRILASTHAVKTKRERTLLLVGNSVSPNKTYPELSRAAAQMESVARHFPGKLKVFAREKATPAAYLESNPERFSYIHFVAHGTANRLSPLDSAIVLSKSSVEDDSFKLYARDIILRPMQADLVTISACYSSGEGRYSGEGLVGLSWAFLRAGAHSVIAALWEATDVSTQQLMDKFYDELDKGAGPDAALRAAKLSLLHNSSFHNAFYWAPFQLYTRLG
jgi:CHAT domain-containing protein/tetratricopeptide (TPR) repeat protein